MYSPRPRASRRAHRAVVAASVLASTGTALFGPAAPTPNPDPLGQEAAASSIASAGGGLLARVTEPLRPASAAAAGAPRFDARERAVLARVNAVRADHGLAPFAAGGRLARAADRHSLRQQRARTLSHQLPGESPLMQRLAKAARATPVGEVVLFASGGTSSAKIVRAWMDSPGHRSVLLSPDFGRAGIGIRTGAGGAFATMDVAAR